MERTDYQSIGDLVRTLLSSSALDAGYKEIKAINNWQRVVGTHIASQCGRPSISNGVMTVRVANAPLRNELNMVRSKIIASINRETEAEVVRELRFIY